MTPSEIAQVKAMLERAYPQIAGGKWAWTADDWRVFAGGMAGVHCDLAQCQAAIDELKRSSDKFPKVSLIIPPLRKLSQNGYREAAIGQNVHRPVHCLLTEMRNRNQMDPDAKPVQIVCAEWLKWAKLSMSVRGECPAKNFDAFRADLAELARITDEGQAMDYWDEMVERVRSVPLNPEMAAFFGSVQKSDPEKMAAMLGKDWKVKYQVGVPRHKRLAEMAEVLR